MDSTTSTTVMAGSQRFGRVVRHSPDSERALDDRTDVRKYADDIEATLRHGFRWLRFPGRMEKLFERETSDHRREQLFYDGIIGVVVYLAFLISDYFMIPDVFGTALVVRVGIMTPLSILVLFVLWWGTRPLVRELIEMSIFICSGISVTYLVAISHHPNSAFFHNMVVLVVVYANAVVRLRFWYAVAASGAILVFYLGTIPFNGVQPPPGVQLNYIAVLISAILFTLFANYSLERSERLNYLHDLRERIQHADLAVNNARLQELSHLDPLTGIPNRRDLDVNLERLCTSRSALPLSLIMIDVDHFKLYNDRYGHQAGDECLRRVASILQASLRCNEDRAARYGGEEFAVVLPQTRLEDAVEVAERVRQAVVGLMIPHTDSTFGQAVTVSAGVACVDSESTPEILIAAADRALYAAKAEGRNRVGMAGPAGATRLERKIRIAPYGSAA